jgi:hypothetical protein
MTDGTDNYNLCINQGATYARVFIWLQGTTCCVPVGSDGGLPVDLTGYSAALQIRPFALSTTIFYDASPNITLGGILGTITLELPASVTENFTWWQGVYDMLLTSAGGQVTRLLSGSVFISPGVTQ